MQQKKSHFFFLQKADTTCWNSNALNGNCNEMNWDTQLPIVYQCNQQSRAREVPILAFYGIFFVCLFCTVPLCCLFFLLFTQRIQKDFF